MDNGFFQGKQITISGLTSIFLLIGMIVGGIFFFEGRYALASDLTDLKEEMQNWSLEQTCRDLENEIRKLDTKQQYTELQDYEEVWLRQLKREFSVKCSGVNT